MKRLVLLLAAAAILAACASMNDSLTPSARVIRDGFDGSTIVRQPQVNAANFGETFHTLGFEWSQKTPELIYVTAGMPGVTSIQELAFNADGKLFENLKLASNTTTFDGTGSMTSSQRRFVMGWNDFLAVASARTVKMRVGQTNTYTVSSFGPDAGQAIVNAKFAPFITKVQELRGGKP